jgi:AAA+ superfamily predicted ATPase
MVAKCETAADDSDTGSWLGYLEALLPALQRLDALLEQAVKQAEDLLGPEAAKDAYRGLYISQEDAERLLQQQPGQPLLWPGEIAERPDQQQLAMPSSPLDWLLRHYTLDAFEVDTLLLALAPELDLRYARLYAYLQDDITRKRPSVDLALNLFCATAEEKLQRRAHFAPDAPLMRHGLLQLYSEAPQPQASLLSQMFRLDEQVVRLLLGQVTLDPRLSQFCDLSWRDISPDLLILSDKLLQSLGKVMIKAWKSKVPLRLYLQGPPGVGQRHLAQTLACRVAAPLLRADLTHIGREDFKSKLKLVFREAWFQDAVLYLDNMDVLSLPDRAVDLQDLQLLLSEDQGITLMAGTNDWVAGADAPIGVLTLPLDYPNMDQRQRNWRLHLAHAGIELTYDQLGQLAARFRLLPGQIAEAALQARQRALWHTGTLAKDEHKGHEGQRLQDLFAAARAQSGHVLGTLARKIDPLYIWSDIVLPEDAVAQLHELSHRVAHHALVLETWGFAQKLSQGKGISALFSGPSGTGKTMAAEVIANDLGLDLYKIDLASVVSKYIGETEKNLDRIFTAAENANVILFFDEADALFGKRSEVRDSHDRYANLEISYLLQKMESYEGLAILATNLRQNLDESFIRRLAFTLQFPLPDSNQRRRIWQGIWPAETPLADDVDLGRLAERFKLSGGNIKNIALAAAFLAAEDGSSVGMNHLLKATRREYQKMGKQLSDTELNGPVDVQHPGCEAG